MKKVRTANRIWKREGSIRFDEFMLNNWAYAQKKEDEEEEEEQMMDWKA